MTYEEVLSKMHAMPRTHSAPTMRRIEYLLAAMDDPHKALSGRFLHVTGTNGKGSTCAFLTSALSHAGYRVGRFVSPFIMDFCERMEIGGTQIPREKVAALGTRLFEVIEAMKTELGETPLEFEIVTAMGFAWFAQENCDLVVLEVGIGGRDDPTNVVTPLLSVITHIDLDHTELLGETVEAIAAVKGGIIKEGAPCISSAENTPLVQDVLRARCEEMHSTLIIPDAAAAHIKKAKPGDLSFTYQGVPYTLSLSGLYQVENALCAIEALRCLPVLGYPITEEDIQIGLLSATFPARFEVLREKPYVILDGAHNTSGIAALRRGIETYFSGKPILCLCGMLCDKHPEIALADILSYPHIIRVACVTPPSPRAMQADDLAAVFSAHGIEAVPYASTEEALDALRAEQKSGQWPPIICFGSLYLAGEVRGYFGKTAEQSVETMLPILKKRINYYKNKWRRAHLHLFASLALLWLLSIVTFWCADWHLLAPIFSGIYTVLAYLCLYNRMMAYVEEKAFL